MYALALSGGALYAGGEFTSMGGKPCVGIARFPVAYEVMATVLSGEGTALPASQTVAHGQDSAPIAITPGVGWHIAPLTDNGKPVAVTDPSGMDYTVRDVAEDHSVQVAFARDFKPAPAWYLAEGCTQGDFETFLLIQNPADSPATVDIAFQTEEGEVAPPDLRGVVIPPRSRRTLKANDYLTSWGVSARVTATSGEVVCERAVYGNGRAWAHDSIGATAP